MRKNGSAMNDDKIANGPQTGVRRVVVEEDRTGQRLDNFLHATLKGVPKSRIYQMIRKGEVRINKGRARADSKLQGGDTVRIPPVRMDHSAVPVAPGMSLARRLESAVLFEDDALLIVNKPAGIAVHGGTGVNLGMIEALRQLRPECRFLELAHRIDRDTSGCLVICKKRALLRHLHQQIRDRLVVKIYQTAVHGRWPSTIRQVSYPLLKQTLPSGEWLVKVHPAGKTALTHFQVLHRYRQMTLLKARLHTGRTHQIRVHTRHAGHPIIGDQKYGSQHTRTAANPPTLMPDRLFLHASSIGFYLPDGSFREFSAPLPAELATFLEQSTDVSANLA